MTNEELDEARVDEAWRVAAREGHGKISIIAARLAREGWTPPEPVDPDVLAYWDWHKSVNPTGRLNLNVCDAYLAGARMARAQEQERAKVLVEYVAVDARFNDKDSRAALAKYRGEA
jgi:hypothetical protein